MKKINFNPVLEKIRNLDEKKLMYIFLGVLILIFVLDYLVLMRPQIGTLTKIVPEINVLRQNLDQTRVDLARLNQYREETDRLRESLKEAELRVISKVEVSFILEKISLIADSNSILINQIAPDTANEDLLLESDKRRYYRLPVRVQAKGAYHDLGRFVMQLEDNNVQIRLGNFMIATGENFKTHNINLTLHTIVYEEIDG